MEQTEISQVIRRISPDRFKQYSYGKSIEGDHLINHYDLSGNKVAQKFRFKDKTFQWMGDKDLAVPFGLNLYRAGGRKITITEGEIDCLSLSEAYDGKWPVISLNEESSTAKKQLSPHMEFINSFEEIVLWFNNNEKGHKAAVEVASLFEPGKVFIVKTQYADANEALMKEGKKFLINSVYDARLLTPVGIVNANDGGFDSFMETDESDLVFDTPYEKLEVAKGAITTFVSGTGMGKTTMVKEISYDLLMRHKLKIGYVGLEEANKVSKRGFAGIHLNQQIVKKKNWAEFKANPANVMKLEIAYNEVIAPGNLYLFNHFGSLDSDILISKLRFLAVAAKCDFIILDHISIVVSGQESNGNETKVIDMLMTKLRSLVEETGVGMLLISHLKRIEGNKGHEDGAIVSLSHLRGSGAIAQISDKVIGLEGNQQDAQLKNIRTIRMLKDREGGETGILSKATYNKDTGRLLPTNKATAGFKPLGGTYNEYKD